MYYEGFIYKEAGSLIMLLLPYKSTDIKYFAGFN